MTQPPGQLSRRTPISVEEDAKAPPAPEQPQTPPAPPASPRRAARVAGLGLLAVRALPAVFALAGILSVVLWFRVNPPLGEYDAAELTRGGSGAGVVLGSGGTSAGGLNPPGCGVGADAALESIQGDQAPTGEPGAGDARGFAFPTPAPESAPSPDAPSYSAQPSMPTAARAAAPPSVGTAPSIGGSWPRYRGADFSNISRDSSGLARSWGASGPRKLWSVNLGEGHAGAAVHRGKAYVLDYDQNARADALRCLSLADGSILWTQSYPVDVKRNHGMSRTVPAVTDKYVLTLGPKCHVMCADADTGRPYWKMDLVAQYGTKVPTWYAGQCPLIDGNRAIIAPGGKALMIAADLATGKVLWSTPNLRKWQMTHSSVVPMTHAGKKMYLYCASGGVVGVSASDGSVLFETDDWTVSTANIPVPIPVGDGRIFLCGGYNAGAMMIRLKGSGPFTVEKVFRVDSRVFGSDQQSPVLYNGHIYGVIPGGELACLSLDGKQLWKSGSTHRFGLGPYMMAGNLMYILSDKGDLSLVQPNPTGYKELARAKVLTHGEAWAPLALAGGRLLARDVTTMVCLDVAGR